MREHNESEMPLDGGVLPAAPLPELSACFSAETLDLIGTEKATELLEIRVKMKAGIADSEVRGVPQESEALELESFLADPEIIQLSIEISTAHNEFYGKHYEEPGSYQVAASLYDMYLARKDTVVPISGEVIDEAIQREEDHVRELTQTKQEVEDLFAEYDQTADQRRKDRILRDISLKTMWRLPPLSAEQETVLEMYLTSEAVFSKLEYLEKVFGPEQRDTILHYFPVFPIVNPGAPYNKEVTACKFPPLRSIYARRTRLQAMEARREQLKPALIDYLVRYATLMKEGSRRHLDLVIQAGVGAVALAKTTLLQRDAEIGPGAPYPYSELDPESEAYDAEHHAVQLLTAAPLLAKVSGEVAALITEFDTSAGAYKQAWQQALATLGWEQSVAEARETVGGIIARNFDTILNQVKPFAAVAEGRKPRPPRKSKETSAEPSLEGIASVIYDQLHREGDFAPQEKALIAHVASGSWEKIKDMQNQVRGRYDEIVAFARRHNLEEPLAGHDVAKVLQFSPDDALESARAEVRRLRNFLLKILTPDQYIRLQAALEAAAERDNL